MSEVIRMDIHRLAGGYKAFQRTLSRVEIFVATRPGALRALRRCQPSPETLELHGKVLLATQEEIEVPRIGVLRLYGADMERLVKTGLEHPDAGPTFDVLFKQRPIVRGTLRYYKKLEQDTKQVFQSARFKSNPELYNALKALDDVLVREEELCPAAEITETVPSNVRRMDVYRAEEMLDSFTRTTDELESFAERLPEDFDYIISTSRIAQLFPEYPFLMRDTIEGRDFLLQGARKIQDILRRQIEGMRHEPPD